MDPRGPVHSSRRPEGRGDDCPLTARWRRVLGPMACEGHGGQSLHDLGPYLDQGRHEERLLRQPVPKGERMAEHQ